MGSLARRMIALGETIWHGIQVAVRTAAHMEGETLQTGITIVQSGLRIASSLAETMASIVKAAAGAMSAMASIPYVGPILAIAAMGAIIAAGARLMKGFAVGEKVDARVIQFDKKARKVAAPPPMTSGRVFVGHGSAASLRRQASSSGSSRWLTGS